jgi:hypothetical protein
MTLDWQVEIIFVLAVLLNICVLLAGPDKNENGQREGSRPLAALGGTFPAIPRSLPEHEPSDFESPQLPNLSS